MGRRCDPPCWPCIGRPIPSPLDPVEPADRAQEAGKPLSWEILRGDAPDRHFGAILRTDVLGRFSGQMLWGDPPDRLDQPFHLGLFFSLALGFSPVFKYW